MRFTPKALNSEARRRAAHAGKTTHGNYGINPEGVQHDGGLIGGASLKSTEFLAIARA